MTKDRNGKNVIYLFHKEEFFKSLPAGTIVKDGFGKTFKKIHNMKNGIIGQTSVLKRREKLDTEKLTCSSYEAYLKMMDAYEDLHPF